MTTLILAALCFILSHLILSATPVRTPMVAKLGSVGFMGLYSVVAIATFLWMLHAYSDAPHVETWFAPTALAHIPAGIMPFALLFIVGAYTSKNPTIVGAQSFDWASHQPIGIMAITRHPMAWGVGLWAISHMMTGGSLARLILFAAIGTLGFFGAWHQDKRKEQQLGAAWPAYIQKTSFLPFAATLAGRAQFRVADLGWWRIALALGLYGGAMALHGQVIGQSPLPL